ncbi:MAG TPA: amidase domain-containing protein [Acetivibrio sp.]|uniref:amidase domain-containing protein n=1 Tax=Acetivibrio sp. TaxID=1872092 RepID=UPI002CD608B8|nr:amidase domain-containing protein [Acetivibrio sp.]HOM01804.1 amidase domain-containing protein [Acetivibrio sp.]
MNDKRAIRPYNREKAVEYAHKWAFGRNPKYFNFDKLGGDCTNFASQVLFAGSNVMNYTPTYGWYYIDANRRTPSWTGVNYLYNFLVSNKGPGPYAEESDVKDIKPGDIIQLSFGKDPVFDHSPVVVQVGSPVSLRNILVAAHTYDRDYYPITNYNWVDIRFIHILGVRT